MREEYDIENLNPRKNLYAAKLKKQIIITIDSGTVGRRFRLDFCNMQHNFILMNYKQYIDNNILL